MISPDGRWVAYVSDESGEPEVYVTSFPDAKGKWQISAGWGTNPVWARNGRELYYLKATSLLAAPITTDPAFRAGAAKELFTVRAEQVNQYHPTYDVDARGRFLMITTGEGRSAKPEVVVVTGGLGANVR